MAARRLWMQWQLGSPTATATLTSTPTVEPTPGLNTARLLASVAVPPRDAGALAARFSPPGARIADITDLAARRAVEGEQARFWVANSDTMEVFQITATLRLVSQYAEFWIEDGYPVDQKALERAATTFDERIYPTVRDHFGPSWASAIGDTTRVAVLNARFTGAAGYFSSHDQYSRQVNPYSNQRQILYLNLDAAAPGTDIYAATLSHEFQHLLHWHLDSNEDGWVNEGASELASRLAGFGIAGTVGAFGRSPDTQLNAWAMTPDEDTLPHYGASYLWLEYFLQRLGPDAVRAVIAEQANGIDGFERVLAAIPGEPTFDDLFADWVIANLLDDASLLDGRFGYEIANPRMVMHATIREVPFAGSGTVSQYGTHYVALEPHSGPIRIDVWGSPTVPVVPNVPYRGRYQWWSNRGDMSNTTLTRAFDLAGLETATLQYALWYEIEDGWDYAYVSVSTDGGARWQLLSTEHTTDYNPNGNAFGPGFTGFSGHPPGSTTRVQPTWVRDRGDLTRYVGQRILVRFEIVTDDAVNLPGLCLDEIEVPELGFRDDAETDLPGWEAEGFVRIDNQLPQRLLVQVVEPGAGNRIHRLYLEGDQHGAVFLDTLGRGSQRAILAISGLTRYTTEPAQYSYSVTATNNRP
jgi:hypothetical protein